MQVLIAPNAFKHALDAAAAAECIRQGLMESRLECDCTCFPVADGGDGTGELIVKKLGGKFVETNVHDPFGESIIAGFGLIDDGNTAVIEMASASGISLVKSEQLNPLLASSFGTGEQIKAALDLGVKKIIIGMGGSATVDGGCGILAALGIQFFDEMGNRIGYTPESLEHLSFIDQTAIHPAVPNCEFIVLCDVNNFLLGSRGAATIFGPQKGASAEGVEVLEKMLANLSAVSFRQTGKDMSRIVHGGTAGGAAAGLYAWINARLVDGISYFLELTEFDAVLEKADIVITGEGSIDEQTLLNKAPIGVARKAKEKGIPVIGIAGKLPLQISRSLHEYFDVLIPISHEPMELSLALKHTSANLERTGFEIGNMISIGRL